MSADTPINTVFTTYDLDETEQLTGTVYSSNQLAVLRNKLSETVQQKLRLVFDPANVMKYTQDEAFLTGQISILEFLLDAHAEALVEIAAIARDSESE